MLKKEEKFCIVSFIWENVFMITWNIRRRIQVHSMFMECTLASGTFEIIVSCFSCWGWLSSWDWNILWCNYILAFSSYFLGWKLLRISPGLPVSPSGAKLSVQALTTSWTHRKADLDPCYYVLSSFSFFYYSLDRSINLTSLSKLTFWTLILS